MFLPSTKTIKECSWAIFVCCITALGFQKDATLALIRGAALDAIVVACLTSGISFLLATLHRMISHWLYAGHILPALIHIGAFIHLSVACASSSISVGLITWSTTPHVFTGLAIACGSLIAALILAFVISMRHGAGVQEDEHLGTEPPARPINDDLEKGEVRK
ncbi:hypothetical protein BOTBODRAFT_208183 [Botryobasidium botryosum FD-172 SS1]|uniref:Uncharacterized protein n=1 Tax=Botryobasidium botryosum (strain FD-172 SS1) TaxID=930990 RepID=A0A067NCS7_BOTB1|nr:hypothetical protein BOTBODRAFT_208183 [Botryobasidium botryosum FD-172 SS1]